MLHWHRLRTVCTEQIYIPFFLWSMVRGRAFPDVNLPRCYQFSRTDWKLTYSTAAMTFSDISHTWPSCFSPQYSGPCDSFNCLDYSKNRMTCDGWTQGDGIFSARIKMAFCITDRPVVECLPAWSHRQWGSSEAVYSLPCRCRQHYQCSHTD